MIKKLIGYLQGRRQLREREALTILKARYHAFRIFLENNGRALELLVTIDSLLNRGSESDIRVATEELLSVTGELVDGLNLLSGDRYAPLYALHGHMARDVMEKMDILARNPVSSDCYCVALDDFEPTMSSHVGIKASNLARLKRMALPVPDGFICTISMCKRFISNGRLANEIRELLQRVERSEEEIARAATLISQMIRTTPLPDDVSQALEGAYRKLARNHTGDANRFPAISVRSSGVSEDSAEFSFAGQFTSILNVQGLQQLFDAYREVLVSGFSARAISYRLNGGMSPVDFDLGVLCQMMVDATCAGVLFTRDPSFPESGRMLISAVPGLGTMAVGGNAPVDLYHPKRLPKLTDGAAPVLNTDDLMDGAQIPRKTVREVAAGKGGLQMETVADNEAEKPLLSPKILAELVQAGELLESVEGGPQDIEWALSRAGVLALLQTRSLRLTARSKGKRIRLPAAATPLVRGMCAVAGKAVGQVRIIHSAGELERFGIDDMVFVSPCILVLPQSIVDAAGYLASCAGVVIDIGNPTDHLSCIAREYGVPMVTGTRTALSVLQEGQWVIVDADTGTVVAAPESLRPVLEPKSKEEKRKAGPSCMIQPQPKRNRDIPEDRQVLRQMIVPLNLTDAYGATFSRMECRSIHDIIRYTHEMAVLSMFNTGDMVMEDAGQLLRPLMLDIPFSCLVIDVGGGVRKHQKTSLASRLGAQRPIYREDVLSMPLIALCDGLMTPNLSWHEAPDAEAFQGILSRTLIDQRSARPAGSFNYALAARDYLNLNARVEFHFAMLDAVCGRDSRANYIRFRFKGGGAGMERSHRRALFLRHVLEANGFFTTVVGDLVTASLTGAPKELVSDKLVMLGRLLGFSRFLDGVMNSDATPHLLAEAFLAGRYDARIVSEEVAEQELV